MPDPIIGDRPDQRLGVPIRQDGSNRPADGFIDAVANHDAPVEQDAPLDHVIEVLREPDVRHALRRRTPPHSTNPACVDDLLHHVSGCRWSTGEPQEFKHAGSRSVPQPDMQAPKSALDNSRVDAVE